jgi:hypothetical protein
MIRSLVLVFLVSVALVACKKADEIGPIPEIEFVSVTPGNVQEYADSLVFTIKYRDGDGDSGRKHFRMPRISSLPTAAIMSFTNSAYRNWRS